VTRPFVISVSVLALLSACRGDRSGEVALQRGSHGDAAPTVAPPAAPSASPASATTPFAVVELYTSEGCNSCPPADAALADWVATSREQDARVFPIAFHVDYWDELGWPDPYADRKHAMRQREYATVFGTRTIYTPQMIVNGVAELNGSNRDGAKEAIARALAAPATASVALAVESGADGAIVVRWRIDGAPDDAKLALAVVERDLVSRVRAGENGGKTLHHENVVRAFRSVAIGSGDGATTLVIPSGVRRSRSEIVGFVQVTPQRGAIPIVGAARVALPD
jgi:hypothetical protein